MAHARRFNPLLHIYMGVGLEADKLLPAGAASKPLDGHEGIGGMRFHGDGAGEQVGVCFFQPEGAGGFRENWQLCGFNCGHALIAAPRAKGNYFACELPNRI